MHETLLVLGLACIIAAVVGGGLTVQGIKVPVVTSLARQTLLAAVGFGIIVLAFVAEPRHNTGRAPQAGHEPLPAACVAQLRATAVESGAERPPGGASETIAVHAKPSAIAATTSTVWVAHADGKVTKIDVRKHPPVATLLPQRVGGPREGAVSIAVGTGEVWVTKNESEPTRGTVARIDSSETIHPLPRDFPGVDSVAYGAGAVWLGSHNGSLTRLSPLGAGAHRQNIQGTPHGLAVAGACVYVATTNRDGYEVFAAKDGRPIQFYDIRPGHEVATGAGALWFTDDARKRSVLRVDPERPWKAESIPVGITPAIDALAAGDSGAWTADGRDTLVRVDPVTHRSHAIPLRGGPWAIAMVGHTVWVAGRVGATVTRLEP